MFLDNNAKYPCTVCTKRPKHLCMAAPLHIAENVKSDI